MTVNSRALRVASWNIRAAIGPGEPFPPAWWTHVAMDRLARIAEVIGALDADVVALQEVAVFTSDGALMDQPAELARLSGMHVRYGAVHAFRLVDPDTGHASGASTWGNALLSREPMVDVFATSLPIAGDDDLVEPVGAGLPLAGVPYALVEAGAREPRCAVGGRISAPFPAWITTAHLSYAGSGQRHAQAQTLALIAADLGVTALVVGDFNAPIEAPELAPLTEAHDDAFARVGIPPGDARRASCGPSRIDHLLTRGLRAVTCQVHAEAGDASDHLPVVGAFELASRSG